jgi:hypothetical protein
MQTRWPAFGGSEATLDAFKTDIHANQSHLEGLILAMAQSWADEKTANQSSFEISGLWGAGDITTNAKEPITSFLQRGGDGNNE